MRSPRPGKASAAPDQLGMWPTRRRPRRSLWPQVLELAAIIGFMAACYHGLLWYWQFTSPKEVAVPGVVGLTENEAIRVLSTAGLRPEVTIRKASEKMESGHVISSDPLPERRVKVGRKVRLTVSSGSRWSLAPDVREMSVDRARALISQHHLEVGGQRSRFHERVPIGYVISQDPRPEAKVARGSEVDLVVSKGPAPEVQPVEEEPKPEVRSARIEYVIPPGASLQEVRIVVEDSKGERTIYRNFHKPDEKVAQTVTGEGPNAVVRLYVSGILAEERSF